MDASSRWGRTWNSNVHCKEGHEENSIINLENTLEVYILILFREKKPHFLSAHPPFWKKRRNKTKPKLNVVGSSQLAPKYIWLLDITWNWLPNQNLTGSAHEYRFCNCRLFIHKKNKYTWFVFFYINANTCSVTLCHKQYIHKYIYHSLKNDKKSIT